MPVLRNFKVKSTKTVTKNTQNESVLSETQTQLTKVNSAAEDTKSIELTETLKKELRHFAIPEMQHHEVKEDYYRP